jgi:hypothetical protein
MNLDFWCAASAGASAIFLLTREAMLSPHNKTFPAAPPVVRGSLFINAMAHGVTSWLFFEHQLHAATPYAGAAEGAVLLAFGGCAIMNAALFGNVLAQRYKPEVWRRLDRAAEVVKRSCRPRGLRPALVQRRRS